MQLCRNKQTGEQAAIKFIERGDRVNKYVEAEILNHRMLRHPHVIELKEVFLTPEFICIVMEFATGEICQRMTCSHLCLLISPQLLKTMG